MSVLPDEPARLGVDAALPLLDVDSTELHGAGGVEEPAVACFQDGQAGPPQVRVEGEFGRAAGRVPGAQEVPGVPDGECAVAGAHQRLGRRGRLAGVEPPAAGLVVVAETAGTRASVHADILAHGRVRGVALGWRDDRGIALRGRGAERRRVRRPAAAGGAGGGSRGAWLGRLLRLGPSAVSRSALGRRRSGGGDRRGRGAHGPDQVRHLGERAGPPPDRRGGAGVGDRGLAIGRTAGGGGRAGLAGG